MTYTLVVTFSGGPAQQAVVTDDVPSSTGVAGVSSGGSVNGSQITWNLGNMAPGSAVTLSFSVTVGGSAPNGGSLSNTAAATYQGGSVQNTNNSVTVVAPTDTPTASSTPQAPAVAVVYPNPSSGGPVNVMPPAFEGTAEVKVQVFTLAFRKVQEQVVRQTQGPLTLLPADKGGNPLSSGLYYVVVTVTPSTQGRPSLRSVVKLLLLR